MKRAYIIFISVVVVAAVVLLLEWRGGNGAGDFKPFTLYPKLEPKDVSKIEITYMLNGILLKKGNDDWTVTPLTTKMKSDLDEKEGVDRAPAQSYRADPKEVEGLLDKLSNLKVSSLASDNPDKRALYQVGELAKRIRLYSGDGKRVADLYVGKNGPLALSAYVRREGDDKVYIVDDYISGMTSVEVANWRDREIWSLEPDDIVEVAVKKGGKGKGTAYLIHKDEDGWYLKEPAEKRLDQAAARAFIEKISGVTATRFAYPMSEVEMGLSNPVLLLDVKTADGQERVLTVGGTEAQGYLHARLEGGEEIYLVEADLPENIPSDPSQLESSNPND